MVARLSGKDEKPGINQEPHPAWVSFFAEAFRLLDELDARRRAAAPAVASPSPADKTNGQPPQESPIHE